MEKGTESSTVITLSENGLEVKVSSKEGKRVKIQKSLFGLTISSEDDKNDKSLSKLEEFGSSASIYSVIHTWFFGP